MNPAHRIALPVVLICAAELLAPLPAIAAPPQNLTRSGVAVSGYDVVAYRALGVARKGSEAHAHDWNGAHWLFASAKHRDLFAEAPERYAPQYGGYCAYAMSRGDLVKIDPEAFSIVDDKLYLNYSPKVRTTWDEARDEYIGKADEQWKKLSMP